MFRIAMEAMNNDKRRLERVDVSGAVRVIDTMRDSELGKLVNLHQEGFLLLSNEDIKEGSLYQLKFLFSEPVGEITEISIGAECLWQSETGTGVQFWAGFHIMDISESGVGIIVDLIKKFGLN